MLLLALTGLRIGELLPLRWKHVKFSANMIRVRETFYEGRFGPPKTRSSRRDVPMSQSVREILGAMQGESGPDDVVFRSRGRTPIIQTNLANRVLQPACRKLGLPAVGWHSFRPTHGTLLGEVGESVKTAQACSVTRILRQHSTSTPIQCPSPNDAQSRKSLNYWTQLDSASARRPWLGPTSS